jgi:hypothetical protein
VRLEVVEIDGKCIDKILATPIPSGPSQDPRRLNRKPESTLSLVSTWPVCRLLASTRMTVFHQPYRPPASLTPNRDLQRFALLRFLHRAAAARGWHRRC